MTKPLSLKQLKEHDPRTYWINETIASIEADPEFSMRSWGECIGFHACKVTRMRPHCEEDVLRQVARLFKIGQEEAIELCLPRAIAVRSKADAIVVLKGLRDSGEVRWPTPSALHECGISGDLRRLIERRYGARIRIGGIPLDV